MLVVALGSLVASSIAMPPSAGLAHAPVTVMLLGVLDCAAGAEVGGAAQAVIAMAMTTAGAIDLRFMIWIVLLLYVRKLTVDRAVLMRNSAGESL